MGKVQCTCDYCSKIFTRYPSDIKQGKGKYCSRECHALGHITKVQCTCLKCGKIFEVSPSDIKNGSGKYCSRDCFFNHLRTRVQCTCECCGKVFDRIPAKFSKGKTYCSPECRALGRISKVERTCAHCGKRFKVGLAVSKRTPSKYCSQECMALAFTHGSEQPCAHCGKLFYVRPSTLKNGRKYCSRKCSGAATRGANHPFWRGGTLSSYGTNWRGLRKVAYERDGGDCQVCHRKRLKSERRFQVHHIVKARYFNGDSEAANDPRNLITLCPQCHAKAEHSLIPVPVRLF